MNSPHVVVHEAALVAGTDTLGLMVRDSGDLLIIDGRAGDDVAVIMLAKGVKPPRRSQGGALLALVIQEGGDGITLADGRSLVALRLSDTGVMGKSLDVTLRPVEVDIFDRVRGVFETDVLRDSKVAVLGVGSGGSFIAMELAKAGVGHFVLVDHDRLEAGNVCRHECGLSDLGRLKVHAVRDLIRDRNPTADVKRVPLHIDGKSYDAVVSAIGDADLVICATDNRESRLLANRMTMKSGVPTLMGAVFRRAYGGQVIRIIPGLTPCYQCFVDALPALVNDQEISSDDAAAAVAYSDRPVPVEPGLSADLLPIALQMVKLSIVSLLGSRPTTLASLRADLVAPIYLWLNRREAGTDYESLPPLENRVDEMTILRWYGIYLARNDACPACGDFEGSLLTRYGLDASDVDTALFGSEDPAAPKPAATARKRIRRSRKK